MWSGPCRRESWKRLLQQSRCRSESGSRAQPVPVNHRGDGLRLEIAALSAAAEGFRVPVQQNWRPRLSSPSAQRLLSVCPEKSGLAAGGLGLGIWEGLCSRESADLPSWYAETDGTDCSSTFGLGWSLNITNNMFSL